MSIPRECNLVDLSKLSPLTNRLIVQLLLGNPGLSQKASLYRRNYIRLLDLAFVEYHKSRESILAQIKELNRATAEMQREGRFLFILSFTDHMEICVNAISRILKILDRLKAETHSPGLPKDLRKLLGTQYSSISPMRNAIEHMDELIRNDEIDPGNPVMIEITEGNDAIKIADLHIRFDDLTQLLRNLYEAGLYILTLKKVTT